MKKIDQHLLPDRFKEEDLEIWFCWANELEDKYISQLVEKSRQSHILEFEEDEDAKGRFKDKESYKKWAGKSRVVYLLKPKNSDDIGGILWFGQRTNPHIKPKFSLTFGIRLYEGFVGRRLSKPFMALTHEHIRNFFDDRYIWLDYEVENVIARKAYGSFGYQYLAEGDGRIIMGKKL